MAGADGNSPNPVRLVRGRAFAPAATAMGAIRSGARTCGATAMTVLVPVNVRSVTARAASHRTTADGWTSDDRCPREAPTLTAPIPAAHRLAYGSRAHPVAAAGTICRRLRRSKVAPAVYCR